MHESQPRLAPADADTSRAALDFLHAQLLGTGNTECGLTEFLDGLAAAFRAAGAGLATMEPGSEPVVQVRVPAETHGDGAPFPWQVNSSWLEKLGPDITAMQLEPVDQCSFLVAACQKLRITPGFIWLTGDKDRKWSAGERAALSLAASLLSSRPVSGQAVPRWATQLDRDARQRQLELAAQVTRRLAHDFGNIMTGILGFTELALSQQIPNTTPLYNYLTETHKAAQNGARFSHQLRLLSRRQPGSLRPTSLPNLFAEEKKRCGTGNDSDPKVVMNADPELPPMAIDPELLRQALNALLENARESILAAGSGSVTVSAHRVDVTAAECRDWYGDVQPGPHVEIRVTDTGAGLDPEAARRLFAEPFFSTKPRKRAFGLTLAFGIVSCHRGGLEVQPNPQGGVVARFLLPVAAEGPPAKQPRVLVVDDDPLILQFVCTTLERAGYQVQKASSAADAFHSYMTSAPDLVLSDVAMPQENGIELARRLLTRDANVRLVFMSGKIPSDLADREFVARQFQLLSKPFRPDSLLKAVRAALDPTAREHGVRPAVPSPA